MKKSTSQWNVKEGFVELKNIDPVPPESGSTHRIFRYLSPGDYQILIKVEDNWGFYSCVGLSGFSDPNDANCLDCCVENSFIDGNIEIEKYCEKCEKNQ